MSARPTQSGLAKRYKVKNYLIKYVYYLKKSC